MEIQDSAPIFLALVVRDLERSIGFYRDVLGMEEIKRVDVSDAKAAKGGFAKRGFRFRTFRMGPLALKLVAVEGEPATTRGLVDDFTGVRYIAFAVDDIDAVARQLADRGVEFASEILPPEPDQGVARLVFFKDPDGNLLELYGD
ncbi:MAG: VOC family protein [Defluviicoccus sp.]|nr:VOC family protein [Defluviicoccus sp.]MDE0383380.1 VOC family protein [Defluviicoccus sp.]